MQELLLRLTISDLDGRPGQYSTVPVAGQPEQIVRILRLGPSGRDRWEVSTLVDRRGGSSRADHPTLKAAVQSLGYKDYKILK